MIRKPNTSDDPAELRRRAEARLDDQRKGHRSKAGDQKSEADTVRALHELEVHQIELEIQNAELQKARDELEVALEKYTDLYDFAPVGYFSIDESGVVLEANLTSAVLLGVERSRLINRRLPLLVSPTSRPDLLAFLKKVFTEPRNQTCEAQLLKEGSGAFWASFRATSAVGPKRARKWCRLAFGDITSRKEAEEAQRRVKDLAETNRGLNREIARRRTAEKALLKSKEDQGQLLEQSRFMQEHLRELSHQILSAQEEERKRISRELHDVIAQTLTGINVHLASLKMAARRDTKGLDRSIARTQRLVEDSVRIIHQFARELRPAVLDDLGLIPALNTFMKHFRAETGIRVSLSAEATAEQVDGDKRTVLYRVAQEALANIARHAQANRADVEILKLDRAVCMTITDDGKGFQQERVLQSKKMQRLGLLGMRERVQMVGGNFIVHSAPGKGTTIRVQIPLAEVRGGGRMSLLKTTL